MSTAECIGFEVEGNSSGILHLAKAERDYEAPVLREGPEAPQEIRAKRPANYPLDCDLLSIATMASTTKPAAQMASITSEAEIKSWATS